MRVTLDLHSGWQFAKGIAASPGMGLPSAQKIELPHCFNAGDPSYRGLCTYRRKLHIAEAYKGQCLFLEFEGVNSVCTVYLNDINLGQHKGGYSTFRFEITNLYDWTRENELTVWVDNTHHEDTSPLGGDFSILGGIYRDVKLVCTPPSHFDMLHFGSKGVFLTPTLQPEGKALVRVDARVVQTGQFNIKADIYAPDGQLCATQTGKAGETSFDILIEKPLLWDGKKAPHLYHCVATLYEKEALQDQIELGFGIRSIRMDPESGFYLNGEHLHINGVSKHQDWAGKGNATGKADLDRDMELIQEIGANAVRLSHYQHPQYFYDLCDKAGMVVWAEIPMLSMPDDTALMENAKQQLTELVLQNYHHPSICFWGLQNEIAMHGETIAMYRGVEELHQLAKQLDPSRLTASANLYTVKNGSPLNFISDMVGYNVYFGWYYDEMEDYGPFLDRFHWENPDVPLGISEYGVDCNTALHSGTPNRKDLSEDFQALFHETVYPQIASRPFVWGSFVWNMFDFSSTIRDLGRIKGLNTKGLVTHDRQTKKDAFYYYKAQWSAEPFVYIASRRFKNRHTSHITVKVYSNCDTVTLAAGSYRKTLTGDRIFIFEDVPLDRPDTTVTAASGQLADTVVFTKVEQPDAEYIYIDPNPGFNVQNWFKLGESKEDLFPDDRYSLMDSISDLIACEPAWALVSEALPSIVDDPRNKNGSAMPLFRIVNRFSSRFDEATVKELNRQLNRIPKQAKEKEK